MGDTVAAQASDTSDTKLHYTQLKYRFAAQHAVDLM
jgi:hypothetical protein